MEKNTGLETTLLPVGENVSLTDKLAEIKARKHAAAAQKDQESRNYAATQRNVRVQAITERMKTYITKWLDDDNSVKLTWTHGWFDDRYETNDAAEVAILSFPGLKQSSTPEMGCWDYYTIVTFYF